MKEHINSNTIANTVRMAAHSRRPKAVFLASDQRDVSLAQTLVKHGVRIIPTHSRENAVQAFQILVASGWEGVLTPVDSRFAPASEHQVLGNVDEQKATISLEGRWDEIQARGSMLNGQQVRVTVMDEPGQSKSAEKAPNRAMLNALVKAATLRIGLHPKADKADYLREAREGGIYGFPDHD